MDHHDVNLIGSGFGGSVPSAQWGRAARSGYWSRLRADEDIPTTSQPPRLVPGREQDGEIQVAI